MHNLHRRVLLRHSEALQEPTQTRHRASLSRLASRRFFRRPYRQRHRAAADVHRAFVIGRDYLIRADTCRFPICLFKTPAITIAPRFFAVNTAERPTPPAAPATSTVWPALDRSTFGDQLVAGCRHQGQSRRFDQIESLRVPWPGSPLSRRKARRMCCPPWRTPGRRTEKPSTPGPICDHRPGDVDSNQSRKFDGVEVFRLARRAACNRSD